MRKFGVREVFSDDWRQTAFWLSVAIAMLIAGFALGWIWRDRPEALANVRILDVMTAIGTVGATIAAVGVALWQARHSANREKERQEQVQRDQQDRNHRLAALAAAALVPRLRMIEDEVDFVLTGLQLYTTTDINPEPFNHLANQLQGIDLAVPLDQLLLIEVLPDGCADDVAAGLARLSQTRANIVLWREAIYDPGTTGAHRMLLVERWTGEIAVALAAVSSARGELTKWTRTTLRHVNFNEG